MILSIKCADFVGNEQKNWESLRLNEDCHRIGREPLIHILRRFEEG